MNKKMLFAGALALVGFVGLTAFDGKTLAQQKEEIAAAVTAKLETLRSEKAAECDTRVQTEATTRFDAWKMEQEAAPAAPAKGGAKKGTSKGPKVDPLPTKPAPTDPQKTRGGAVQPGNAEQQKERSGSAAPTQTPEQQKKRGGAAKQGGGK
jgi:hypothetical protein